MGNRQSHNKNQKKTKNLNKLSDCSDEVNIGKTVDFDKFLPEFSIKLNYFENVYEMKELISSGKYGVVQKVIKENGEICAVKIIQKETIVKDSDFRQSKDEILVLSSSKQHPFIIEFFESWQNSKYLFIAMEYIPNADLFQVWTDVKQFSEHFSKHLVAQISMAIDYLHNLGFIYRDIKMENILFDKSGYIKLIDFGFSKRLGLSKKTNTICGTLQYMAPEVLSGKSYSNIVDWWSLGVLLYALLTSYFPVTVQESNHIEVYNRLKDADISIPYTLSNDAADILNKLLKKDPKSRINCLKALKFQNFFVSINFDMLFSKSVDLKSLFEKEIMKNSGDFYFQFKIFIVTNKMNSGIKISKQLLRKDMKKILKGLSNEEKERQGVVVTNILLKHPIFLKSKRISIFLNMSDEVPTLSILKQIFDSKKECFIPKYFPGGNRMEMVKLNSWDDYEALPRTKWNIKQPALEEDQEEALSSGGLDLILMPGLAFTVEGKRLGRGGGYYDTYLKKCIDNQCEPFTLALAFKQQVIEDIPTDDHDMYIKEVLYEK